MYDIGEAGRSQTTIIRQPHLLSCLLYHLSHCLIMGATLFYILPPWDMRSTVASTARGNLYDFSLIGF